MKTAIATAPLDFVGSPRRDPLEDRRRHFAAGERWAHQMCRERTVADKQRAYVLMISSILAGLRCGQEGGR